MHKPDWFEMQMCKLNSRDRRAAGFSGDRRTGMGRRFSSQHVPLAMGGKDTYVYDRLRHKIGTAVSSMDTFESFDRVKGSLRTRPIFAKNAAANLMEMTSCKDRHSRLSTAKKQTASTFERLSRDSADIGSIISEAGTRSYNCSDIANQAGNNEFDHLLVVDRTNPKNATDMIPQTSHYCNAKELAPQIDSYQRDKHPELFAKRTSRLPSRLMSRILSLLRRDSEERPREAEKQQDSEKAPSERYLSSNHSDRAIQRSVNGEAHSIVVQRADDANDCEEFGHSTIARYGSSPQVDLRNFDRNERRESPGLELVRCSLALPGISGMVDAQRGETGFHRSVDSELPSFIRKSTSNRNTEDRRYNVIEPANLGAQSYHLSATDFWPGLHASARQDRVEPGKIMILRSRSQTASDMARSPRMPKTCEYNEPWRFMTNSMTERSDTNSERSAESHATFVDAMKPRYRPFRLT